MGIPINNPASNRDGCPKISSACVIWQGPTIPCINLCSGDAIDEVVFKLATYLCELSKNIFDIDNISYDCLLPAGEVPTNLEELIQLLINYTCNQNSPSGARLATPSLLSAAKIVGSSSVGEPILQLPELLYYTNEEGDTVRVMLQSDYIVYVATKLCEVIKKTNDYQQQFDSIYQAINGLQVQVNRIEASTNDIYIVSQCASSGTPGQQVLIQDAFTTFERNYCNLTSVIGTTTSLYNGINSQIGNLSNLPQLMYDTLQMRNIPGWVEPTRNIGDTLSNLWLTIGDMRNKIIQIANNTFSVPCILLSPEKLTIGTIGMYSADVYWEKPSVNDVQSPTSYSIEVYATSDTKFETPLYSGTKSQIADNPNVLNISTQNLEFNIDYVIHVSSIYQCGISKPSALVSNLRISDIYYEVVFEAESTQSNQVCNGNGESTGYTQNSVDAHFQLVLKDTREKISNNGTSPITIIARFEINSCEYAEPVFEDVTFTIQIGDDKTETQTYISDKLTNCVDGSCGYYNKNLRCGVFISEPTIEFDRKYGSCNQTNI